MKLLYLVKKNRELFKLNNFLDGLEMNYEANNLNVYRCNHRLMYYVDNNYKCLSIWIDNLKHVYRTELTEHDIVNFIASKYPDHKIKLL